MRSSRVAAYALAASLSAVASPAAGLGRIVGRVDRSLIGDPNSAFVYVENVPGRIFVPPDEPAVMEQWHLQFIPHVLPILRGTTVRFPNADRVRHNVFSPSVARPFNLGIYYPRESREIMFDALGTVTLLCNIHEQMSGYIVVLQNPYFGRIDADGRYAIDDVPDGRYSVILWTERPEKPKHQVVVKAGPVDASFAP